MQNTSISEFNDKVKRWKIKLQKLLNTNFDRAFGLDISDQTIEIAELSKLFRFSIENYGRVELPEGIIKDGRILDEKALTERIKLLLQNVKPRHVSTNKVILSLPESQVFIHHFVLNTILSGASLRLMVQKEIVKILPINPSRMYWDIQVKALTVGDTNPLGGTSVVFIGIQKDVAESYVRVCNAVGLDVTGLGLEPLSVARLLISPGDVVTAIVDLGSHTTNVSLIKGNDELEMTITVPIGGHDMTQAIAQGLNVDETVAEAKKVEVGSGTSDELFFLIEPVVKNIASEISRTLSYYESVFKEKVDSILLVGGASVMGGIKEKIGEVIGKPITSASHFNNFENLDMISAKIADKKIVPMLYTSVIGLSMLGASNEFENINLLKQMPSMQINKIKRSELFNSGYLSKSTALRIILNSRLMLVIAVALCAASFVLFSYLWFNYLVDKTYQLKQYKTTSVKIDPLSPKFIPFGSTESSSTLASSTATSTGTSTATSTKKIK